MKIDPEYQTKEIKSTKDLTSAKEDIKEMTFLRKLEFSDEEIKNAINNTPRMISEEIDADQDIVSENITFLKDLGVRNYKEVFINYSDLFVKDCSRFQNIFLKYDKDDLIEKIAKNVFIVEHL